MTAARAASTSLTTAGMVLSFLAPERPFDADVVRSFCHFVHFFGSAHAAPEWTAEHPGRLAVSVDDSFRLGQRTNAAAFGAALDGDGIASSRRADRAAVDLFDGGW